MLQIGSWMSFQDKEGNWHNSQVTLLNDEGDVFYELGSPNDVKPIPLTKEILLNNNFIEADEFCFQSPEGMFVTIKPNYPEMIYDVFAYTPFQIHQPAVNCYYVHTLQFYYKAIFNKDLKLTLNGEKNL